MPKLCDLTLLLFDLFLLLFDGIDEEHVQALVLDASDFAFVTGEGECGRDLRYILCAETDDLPGLAWGIGIVSSTGGHRLKRFDFPPTVIRRFVR